MSLRRRYSVTGQTPPDDVGGMKSPKLQALDTRVQSTACGLCEGGGEVGRTSSKRSATQLPSPSTPSSQELPTKIARLGLEHDDMDIDTPSDTLTDPFLDSDWSLSTPETSASSAPSSPGSHSSECVEHQNRILDIVSYEPIPPEPSTALPQTLLTLPPELRHHIYQHLPDLILSQPLIYCLSTFANKKQHPLASVSRLIRSEALAIFYSYNTWVIKLEYKIMYEGFQDWIVRLGDGAGCLRLVTVAVRGSLFKPRTYHSSSINANGTLVHVGQPGVAVEEYHPPDGDASFSIDLSEKFAGGKVEILRNDGTREAGEKARVYLQKLVFVLWERRCKGVLNGQDWVDMVDQFLQFTGWW